MKPEQVQQFEADQKEYGTEVALYNLIWNLLSGQFKDWLGVDHVHADNAADHEEN